MNSIQLSRNLLILLVHIYTISITSASILMRCSNKSSSSLSFLPSSEVDGRYTIEWCTFANKDVTEWRLQLKNLKDNRTADRCQHYDLFSVVRYEQMHSVVSESFKLNLNCSQVCFSKSLDLIYSACYSIKSILKSGGQSRQAWDSLHYISNQFKNADYFNNSKIYVRTKSYNQDVSAHWFLGYIPVTDYSMKLCKVADNITDYEDCPDIENNCTVTGRSNELVCTLTLPYSCYIMKLIHHAPWTEGTIFKTTRLESTWNFCHPDGGSPLLVKHSEARWGLWVPVAACVLLVLSAMALFAWRSRRLAAARKRVLRDWLQRYEEVSRETGNIAAGINTKGVIVVVRARECESGELVSTALVAALQRANIGQVYDLQSSIVTAMSAGNAADWIRVLMNEDTTRVVIIQSPALALLYAVHKHEEHDVTTAMSSGIRYRDPQPGDMLLQFALNIIRHNAHHNLPYKKYYVVTMVGLETEVCSSVAPYRRYILPGALQTLLSDLGCTQHIDLSNNDYQLLITALQEFAEFVYQNPDYLLKDLMLL